MQLLSLEMFQNWLDTEISNLLCPCFKQMNGPDDLQVHLQRGLQTSRDPTSISLHHFDFMNKAKNPRNDKYNFIGQFSFRTEMTLHNKLRVVPLFPFTLVESVPVPSPLPATRICCLDHLSKSQGQGTENSHFRLTSLAYLFQTGSNPLSHF